MPLKSSKYDVICEDGRVRHKAPFETEREAKTFADYGHLCTAANTHRIVEAKSIEEHISRIEEFIEECSDVDADISEIASDAVTAYIAAEVHGQENSYAAREIRNRVLGD